MTLLGEIHSKELSQSLLDVYWEILSRHSDEVCEAAFNRLIETMRFFPKPADFIDALKQVSGPEPPQITDRATEQINIVMRQIRERGSWRTPAFDDPVTNSLMKTRWSWPSVCAMTETELKWWAKEFADSYLSMQKIESVPMIEGGTQPRLKLLAGGIGR